MDWVELAGSSVAGAMVGALLNGAWSRRSAKKAPKTEMRAEAYRDFVTYIVARSDGAEPLPPLNSIDTPRANLGEIKARMLLFGESTVVAAVTEFLEQHRTLGTEQAMNQFAMVVRQMRKSLLTGYGDTVTGNIRRLLAIPTGGNTGDP